MADLSTTYMGIKLASPIVVGACSLSSHVDRIKRLEELGAGALVIKSLFEEQIELERAELSDALEVGSGYYQEANSYFPEVEHGGPEQHCFWVQKARKSVKMPLIASLNAASMGSWVDWAVRLEETGVDGLELNVFTLGTDMSVSGADIEARLYEVVESVKSKVKIPVSVKLSPYFTSPSYVAKQLDQRGVDALVLFNRFFQPDIDVAWEKVSGRLRLSTPAEQATSLRWIGLLAGRLSNDLIASKGIHDGKTVAKMLLAGANAVQVVSALYVHGLDHLKVMNENLAAWMDEKGYATIDDFKGKLGRKNLDEPGVYERAQYIKLLLGFD